LKRDGCLEDDERYVEVVLIELERKEILSGRWLCRR